MVQAGQKLFITAKQRRVTREARESARTLMSVQVVNQMLAELDGAEVQRFHDYLSSPEFEEIALQYLVGRLGAEVSWDELKTNIRHEIRHGLRNNVGLREANLVIATDAVFDALTEVTPDKIAATDVSGFAALLPGMAAHLVTSVAANSRLLGRLGDLAAVHEFARQLRKQVVAVHKHMRLPHLGVSRSVPYRRLYVDPVLRPEQERHEVPDLSSLPLPGRRSVILGDPGAGKSTLAVKLAHDVAADLVPGAEGRVPFLLVLREFAGSFREGGRTLAHYLEQVCQAPYNLEPPRHAVEYLLGNGRAVVLLDGLDELVEPELRRRFVQLVDGFVSRFPLVPIVVTARRVGYSDAPLDRRMFTVGVVAELADEQVAQYTRRWFALDERTAKADRSRMAELFLVESNSIADLRANPLLLSLLCEMYSSEHYLPTNLAQVYERCAMMLFDRWDLIRGISSAPQFQGRLRAAVQHLAWQLFTDEESGKALPRHRIVRLLANHLVAKQFDEDEATATAETFVEFCTGRAWVLTDVGATETEPRYGFTHRTFLEFFAAEHLVRTHPTAEQLWAVLRPRVRASEWEIVAQIALQLLERNVDGGADALLRLVLAEPGRSDDERVALHGFAARALGHVHPGQDVIRDVTVAALGDTLTPDLADRYQFWSSADDYETLRFWDDALHVVMYDCAPGNLPAVRRTVKDTLRHEVESGNEAASFAVMNLGRHFTDADQRTTSIWVDTQFEMMTECASALAEWTENSPWPDVGSGKEPERVITRFGVQPLYLADLFLTGSLPSVVERLFSSSGSGVDLEEVLLAAPRPWISDPRWWIERTGWQSEWKDHYKRLIRSMARASATRTLLFLPYLESLAHDAARTGDQVDQGLVPPSRLVSALYFTRAHGTAQRYVENELRKRRFTEDTGAFLIAWARNEFDLVSPPQERDM